MSNKLNQIKLTLCLFVILIVSTAALEVCYEEFFDESLGIFNNKYESDALFEVKKYEDFDDVDEPEDSNGYFISQADSGASSIVTGHGTSVPANTEITIAYYTINPGAAETVRWYVTSDTGTLIKSESFFVDDSKSWKYSTITVTRDSSILIRINCPDMSASGGFLAIDKITISTPTSDQCESFTAPDTTTTVTETSITPPTTVTPGTTVTQTSITPPTTVTPGTTVTETSITPPTTVTPGTTVTETTITPPTTDSTITTAKLTTITPPIETTTGTTPATTQKQTTHVTTPASTETETPPTSETTGSSIDTTPIPEQPPWDDSELEKWKTISIVSLTIASVEFVYAIGITAYIVINKRMQNQYEMD